MLTPEIHPWRIQLHYEVGQGMAYTVVFHHIVYYYCLRLAREVVSVVVVWGRERRGYGI
jgi:hypothetical protein